MNECVEGRYAAAQLVVAKREKPVKIVVRSPSFCMRWRRKSWVDRVWDVSHSGNTSIVYVEVSRYVEGENRLAM